MQNKLKTIKIYLCGLAMGAADVVPGVSGGTIAFITGIYEDLLKAIKSVDTQFFKLFFTGQFKKAFAHIPLAFLIPLLLGIGTAIFSLAKIILYLLAFYPLFVWTFFLGLILASTLLLVREFPSFSVRYLMVLSAGTLIAYRVAELTPVQTPETAFFIFLSGAIAICAMILPGISGSFLLVILGKYQFILNAVTQLDFLVIGTFMLGALCGILSFVRLLTYALKHCYGVTLALLTGLMLGSIQRILKEIPPLENSLLPASLCILCGFALPLCLHYLSKKHK